RPRPRRFTPSRVDPDPWLTERIARPRERVAVHIAQQIPRSSAHGLHVSIPFSHPNSAKSETAAAHGGTMAKLARDVMTPDPTCCSTNATLDEVAKLMVQNDCGEIPIVDSSDRPIGVITDRDIVCRAVAEGKNPTGHTVEN